MDCLSVRVSLVREQTSRVFPWRIAETLIVQRGTSLFLHQTALSGTVNEVYRFT